MVLKRKQSAHMACIVPKKTNVAKKPATKADLSEEIKLIKTLNDAMEEEIKRSDNTIAILEIKEKKYLETIKTLQETVQNLKSPSPSKSSDCQTFSDDLQIPCNVCIYVATCEEELNWHKDYDHDISTDLYFETDFPCDICGKWCRTEADHTHHLKLHEVSSKSNDSLVTCKYCAKTFETKTS